MTPPTLPWIVHELTQEAGPHAASLMVNVAHGPPVLVELVATVGRPRVELVTGRLNYGLVRLGSTAVLPLVLRNCSQTCASSWSLEELHSHFAKQLTQQQQQQLGGGQLEVQQQGAEGTAEGGEGGRGAATPLDCLSAGTYIDFFPSSGVLLPEEQVQRHFLYGCSHHMSRVMSAFPCCLPKSSSSSRQNNMCVCV